MARTLKLVPAASGPVQVGTIPEDIIKECEEAWEQISKMEEPFLLQIVEEDKAAASKYALYARAWGMSRDEKDDNKVTVRKMPRKDVAENIVFLRFTKYDPNAPKPGRKSDS